MEKKPAEIMVIDLEDDEGENLKSMHVDSILLYPSATTSIILEANHQQQPANDSEMMSDCCSHDENCPLAVKLRKLIMEKIEYEKNVKEQQEQDAQEKMRLRSLLIKKNEVIQKLSKEVETRDKIFDLCYNAEINQINGNCVPEVFMSSSPRGHRICEIRNKQQVPFTIKTETLSPRIWERLNDDDETDSFLYENDSKITKDVESNNNTEWQEEEKKKNEISEASIFITTNDDVVHESYSNSFETTKPEKREMLSSLNSQYSEASSSVKSKNERKKRSHSNSSKKNRSHKKSKKEKHHQNRIHKKSKKRDSVSDESEVDTNSDQADDNDGLSDISNISSLESNNNVLEIPKLYRTTFGIQPGWNLEDCPVGKKFWYDEKHSKMTKYFIRLDDDRGDWKNETKFTLLEQKGLALPTTYSLKFSEILEKLEKDRKKRIWLDLRDFDLFSPSNRLLLSSIEDSISHFSFGYQFHDSNELLRSNLLLEFIFLRLTNLEYCCINTGMLDFSDTFREEEAPRVDSSVTLPKLKTVRFILTKSEFNHEMLLRILDKAPNLQNLYEIPLQTLRKIDEIETGVQTKICLNHIVRSVFTRRSHYCTASVQNLYFLSDISCLSRSKYSNTLEELDCRSSFIIRPSIRASVVQNLTNIIQWNKKSLKKLTVEPAGSPSYFLEIPTLKNIKVLRLVMTLRPDQYYTNAEKEISIASFFPKGFDMNKKFPSLSTVEIHLDPKSGLNFSESSRLAGGLPPSLLYFEKHFSEDILEGGDVAFKQVKNLKLQRFSPFECMDKIGQIFPNLRILQLSNNLVDISLILPLCFELWPRLYQLILEITDTDTRFSNFDSALTGLAPIRCTKLASRIGQNGELDSLQTGEMKKWVAASRTTMPIFHLAELQLFKIILTSRAGQEYEPGANCRQPIMTPLAALFGFGKELMPRLKVEVGFHPRISSDCKDRLIQSLLPVIPFLTVER